MACVVDFKTPNGEWVGSYNCNGKQVHTRAYKLWHDVLWRCKVGGKYQEKKPTYLGCVNYFDDYQSFAEWCQVQVGYMKRDTNGKFYSLDKDILSETRFVGYAPDTCCFVPVGLNSLLQLQHSSRTDMPIGVTKRDTRKVTYQARINYEGKNKYLGTYDSKEGAHKAWQNAKHINLETALREYEGLVDMRVIDKLKLITYNLAQDINLNKETVEFGGVPLAA